MASSLNAKLREQEFILCFLFTHTSFLSQTDAILHLTLPPGTLIQKTAQTDFAFRPMGINNNLYLHLSVLVYSRAIMALGVLCS